MPVDAGTIYSEIRIKVDKLSGDIQQVNTKLDQFSNKNKQQSEKVKNSWSNAFKSINLAGVAAFATIALAVKGAISTFAKYQQAMANVRSVTSASAADFKRLEDAAMQAGESTRFTASQAADALYYLASAGLDATQSINALNGVLELAGATQSDLAFTSATMAATLSQFSLNASESTRVSNVFASAISNSQATMEKLAVAMKKVGPISGAFDISLEETTANLEALFEAGFTGEESGVALRNIMLGLTQESGPLIEKLRTLGIAFHDVNPQEVGLTNAIEVLADSGIDLAQVFEKRTVAAMLTLAEKGGDALRELQEEITDTNTAAEMYAIQNDTLAGSIDFLNSAMESASIKIGKEIEPALRGLVDFLTDLIRGFNSLPGPLKIAIVAMASIGPVLAAAGAAAAFLAGSLSGIVGSILLIGSALAATGILHSMQATAKETQMVNFALEQAVKNGGDINVEMRKLSETTGMSLDKIKDIAIQNENINSTLLEQEKINNEILTTYQNRAAAVGAELSLNQELLFSNGILGTLYKQQLDDYLGKLEAQRIEIDLLNEQAALEEERARENEARLKEIAALEEEFRLANMTEQERAFDELEQQHRDYLEAGIDDEEWYQREITKIIEQYADKSTPEDNQEAENIKNITELTEQYRNKLERLGATKLELIDLDRQAAITAIKKSEEFILATDEEKKAALSAINEYHEALKDNVANEIFKENIETVALSVLDVFKNMTNSLAQLFVALTEQRIAELDRWLIAELEAAGLTEATTVERLQNELDAAIEVGNLELAEELRQDLERARIEEEYQKKLAQIQYEGQLSAWKFKLAGAISALPGAIINALSTGYGAGFPVGLFLGPALAASAAAAGAIQIAAVGKSKPQPPQLATGGLVIPTGSGGTQVNVAENGSPELLLNGGAEGQALMNDFAKRIAVAGNGSGTFTIILNMDGKRVAESTAKYYNNGIVRVKL